MSRKRVLVTQDLIDDLRYNQREQAGQAGKHALGVDREMQNILARNDVSLSDKVRLYNNALLKFGDVKDSVKKEPAPPLPEEEDSDEWSESIEKHFSLANRSRAQNILEWIRKKSSITWNERGEITGLPGSNLLTLLDELVRKTPHMKSHEPVGMETFASKLKDSNLPIYLISNHYRKYFTSTPPPSPEPPFYSPKSTRKAATLRPTLSPTVSLLPPPSPEGWIYQT